MFKRLLIQPFLLGVIFIKVVVNNKAVKLLRENQRDIIVELKGWSNWNCPTELKPSVSIGIPKNTNAFDFFEVDEYNVYVSRKIPKDAFVEISSGNFYGLEYLIAIIKLKNIGKIFVRKKIFL